MKIAVSARGPSLDADVDPRFGRCQHFVICDPETMEFEIVVNASINASGGAGIAAAQIVTNKDVQAVLTGNVGPKAYQVLSKAGIQIFAGASGKVRTAVETYNSDGFKATSGPTVEEHAGIKPPQ